MAEEQEKRARYGERGFGFRDFLQEIWHLPSNLATWVSTGEYGDKEGEAIAQREKDAQSRAEADTAIAEGDTASLTRLRDSLTEGERYHLDVLREEKYRTEDWERALQLGELEHQRTLDSIASEREWQEKMRGSQIQSAVADAQAAGINPLALTGGALAGGTLNTPVYSGASAAYNPTSPRAMAGATAGDSGSDPLRVLAYLLSVLRNLKGLGK